MCTLSNATNAQTTLIQNVQDNSVLNVVQTQKYQLLTQNDRFSHSQLVQFSPLSTSVNVNGNLELIITSSVYQSECEVLEFAPNTSHYIDDQNYYYFGSLVESDTTDCSCQYGEIMLIAKNGRQYGYFTVDESKYEIMAIDAAYSIIGKVDSNFWEGKQECIAINEQNRAINPAFSNSKVDYRSGNCVIRVLFLFTQAAEDEFSANAIEDMADLVINQTNQAFFSSQIEGLCVQNANIREWEFIENPNDLGGDLDELQTNDLVAQWRQIDFADVVCLITNGDYNNSNTLGASGFMPDPNNPGQFISNLGNPMENLAFMIVEANSLSANYTFSHELGHIMGCRHQTCATFQNGGCDNNGTFEHGHGWGERKSIFCNWRNFSSILHQLRPGNSRLLNYSNPDVRHNNYPTGIADERDNAGWILDGNGCTVANYLPAPLLPTVQIVGDDKICRPFVETYIAQASGSTPPYTYEWHISNNGVNWGNVAGTGISLNVNSNNYPVNSTVFLRVKVTTALGNAIFAFFQIRIVERTECFVLRQSSTENNGLKIYPNPTEGNINISFKVDYDNTPVSVRVYSVTGALLDEKYGILQSGDHNQALPTTGISTGPFIVQVRIGEATSHQLLIKQ